MNPGRTCFACSLSSVWTAARWRWRREGRGEGVAGGRRGARAHKKLPARYANYGRQAGTMECDGSDGASRRYMHLAKKETGKRTG